MLVSMLVLFVETGEIEVTESDENAVCYIQKVVEWPLPQQQME